MRRVVDRGWAFMRVGLIRRLICRAASLIACGAVLICVAAHAGTPVSDLDVLRGDSAVSDGFVRALGPRTFEFPRDHGPHPEFRHEWWYVTGNLDSDAGSGSGFELTIFRVGLQAPVGVGLAGGAATAGAAGVAGGVAKAGAAGVAGTAGAVGSAGLPGAVGSLDADSTAGTSAWRTRQVYAAHFAITDVTRGKFMFADQYSRDALGLAGGAGGAISGVVGRVGAGGAGARGSTGVRGAGGIAVGGAGAGANTAVIAGVLGPSVPAGPGASRWAVRSPESPASPASGVPWIIHARGQGYELSLDAQLLGQPVLNGDHGLSRKSAELGAASYYYSIPRIAVRGKVVREGVSSDVHGLAWLDREWGSGSLGAKEQGWDWFAFQLQDGSALMFYSLRNHDGTRNPNSAGTWVDPGGRAQSLSTDQVSIDVSDHWTSPRGGRYPSRWRVRVPAVGLDVEVRPALANQELGTTPRYWEGAVDLRGVRDGHEATGRGYVELVGYGE